jgi:hypothetical protein
LSDTPQATTVVVPSVEVGAGERRQAVVTDAAEVAARVAELLDELDRVGAGEDLVGVPRQRPGERRVEHRAAPVGAPLGDAVHDRDVALACRGDEAAARRERAPLVGGVAQLGERRQVTDDAPLELHRDDRGAAPAQGGAPVGASGVAARHGGGA